VLASCSLATTPTQSSMLVPMLLVLGVVVLALLLAISARVKVAQRQNDRLSPREQIDQIKSRAESAPPGRQQAVAAEQTDAARSLAAALDNKAERLEQLLVQAEDRIAALEAALAEMDASGRAAPPQRVPLDPLTRSVYELADSGCSTVDIARQLDEQIGKVELILALRSH
jgi:cytoskeletal protein RodZ